RQVGEFDPPVDPASRGPSGRGWDELPFRPVEMLRVGERVFHTWQEAEEREVAAGELGLGAVCDRPHRHAFTFPGRRWREPITAGGTGLQTCQPPIPGVLAREQQAVTGEVEVAAAAVGDGLFRLAVVVRNLTPLDTPAGRDGALMRTLVST